MGAHIIRGKMPMLSFGLSSFQLLQLRPFDSLKLPKSRRPPSSWKSVERCPCHCSLKTLRAVSNVKPLSLNVQHGVCEPTNNRDVLTKRVRFVILQFCCQTLSAGIRGRRCCRYNAKKVYHILYIKEEASRALHRNALRVGPKDRWTKVPTSCQYRGS